MESANTPVRFAILMGVVMMSSCTMRDRPTMATGIRLEIEGAGAPLSTLPEIQAELNRIGVGVWPLRLDDAPDDILRLLGQASLTADETARLRDHFLLSRERLLEIIAASGRTPNVPGGGSLETTVANQGYSYPQLWVVRGGEDYTRFDTFHVTSRTAALASMKFFRWCRVKAWLSTLASPTAAPRPCASIARATAFVGW